MSRSYFAVLPTEAPAIPALPRRGGPWRTCFWALAALMMTLLSGCSEALVDPGSQPATLRIALVVPAVSPILADAGEAFDQADEIRVRVSGSSGTLVDVSRDLSDVGDEVRLQVEVDVDEESSSFLVELEVLWDGRTLFEAERDVSLEPGTATDAEFTLAPVPDRIETGASSVTLDALGAQSQLSAAVVFATGDEIPGATPVWTGSNPEVVEVSAEGTVVATGVGTATATASWQGLDAQVSIQVQQVVAEVDVVPATALLVEGETEQLEATLRDANQNPIPAGAVSVAWSSDDPAVATVDDTGMIEGMSEGSTTIRATADGVTGTATVTVETQAGTVRGTVVDGLGGSPIPGATVDFGEGRSASTDAQGTFELNLPVGTWTATVSAVGFVPLEITGVQSVLNETTDLGTLRLYSGDFAEFFGVWAYLGIVEYPEIPTPDWLVFQPPELFWDVDDGGGCFIVEDADVVLLSIEDDIWSFENRDLTEEEGRFFSYRITFDSANILRMEARDTEIDLTFLFERTSLTTEDFQPECSASAAGAGSGGLSAGAPFRR